MDARMLRALAHPLRIEILEVLRYESATSTTLAKRLDQNTGTVSWHLRHLAELGLIEEDEERGTKRERWWKPAAGSLVMKTQELRQDPGLSGQIDTYLQATLRASYERSAAFMADRSWSDTWMAASVASDWNSAVMTPEQLKAMGDELMDVVTRHIDAATGEEEDALPVNVQLHAFPARHAKRGADGAVE
ncbi:hypothetical protein BIV57_09785 [Mangrovactinospora gilvigrisea]|uniref:HTH arsR-type domain-containing protein n=2 Tax=Mangrovactinospora gilvigrisea TaxID=1428644 RepID=A0A1J7BG91_9ACTN|nr:hypothetical protein BIV57_09785 [Mangrovactinospora gilvigrisea]